MRVGVLLPPGRVERWALDVLEQLEQTEFVTVASVVRAAALPGDAPGRAFRAYERADRALFRGAYDALARSDPPPADEPGDLPDARLDAERLDVIIALCPAPAALARHATHGVWSLRHGRSGGPAFFWELYDGVPAAISELVDESGRVLYRSYTQTNRTSLYRTRNPAYWKAAQFFVRALRRLRDGKLEPLAPEQREERGNPTAAHAVVCAARVAARALRRRLEMVAKREQWLLAYRRTDAGAPALDQLSLAAGQPFQLAPPPPDRFYADPFTFAAEGRDYVFFEDYRYGSARALIACAELRPDGGLSRPEPVLAPDHHLSYPFVFELDGKRFMIPESAATRRVDLFRATQFPHQWALERTLLDDIDAFDATLHAGDGRLWLFVCVPAARGAAPDELCVFSADSLEGPWTPHAANPVVSDVRRARPAGRLFHDRRGRLIRPSQDGSRRYGYAVVLNHVEVLSERAYREVEIARLGPEFLRGNVATHTYNVGAGWEIVDANVQRPAWRRPRSATQPLELPPHP